jgi:squalene synthase HpnC
LLSACSQDVVKTRYANFSEIMDYCNRSASPVGRMLLHLFGRTSAQEIAWSDAICSSLQLINFWQDIGLDWQKGRVYLPQDDMAGHGVEETHIARGQVDARWQRLMAFQIARSRTMLESGAQWGSVLPGRMGLKIRTIIAAGRTIIGKLETTGGDVFRHRPTLRLWDWPAIVSCAFFARN